MSKVWEILDMEIAATPMPESYHKKKVGSIYYYTKYRNIYTLFAIDMTIQIIHLCSLLSSNGHFNLVLQVRILCNDCGAISEVQFHVVGQKCPKCKSYNTRQT
ncbi:unnamed protein product [Musa textilis]